MPLDQFTIWQRAGDLLPNATREQILVTAFNRQHMINGEEGVLPKRLASKMSWIELKR